MAGKREMNRAVIYIHGKGGNSDEAEHYQPLFPGCHVSGFDYRAETPWEAESEFSSYFDEIRQKYDSVIVIANSIGAYFLMNTLNQEKVEKAYFISPIVSMEQLIADLMNWAGVTEDELKRRETIETSFGETLSWEYLTYVRDHPLKWDVPTCILYGGKDHLTSFETISAFAERIGADLTVMPGGEHWFHTNEQMAVLDQWIISCRETKQ